jgi:hypothetical protein
MFDGFEFIPVNCIWAEPDQVVEQIKVLRIREGSRNWTYARHVLDLKDIYYPIPQPGGAHLPRFTVWQPSNMSFGSAMLTNSQDGLIQLVRHLNRNFKTKYFASRLSTDHKKFGCCSFELGSDGSERRGAYVLKDPRWKFFQWGTILPFENPAFYERKKIADRLTPDIVMDYLKVLGWDLREEAFWHSKGDAWLVEKTSFK